LKFGSKLTANDELQLRRFLIFLMNEWSFRSSSGSLLWISSSREKKPPLRWGRGLPGLPEASNQSVVRVKTERMQVDTRSVFCRVAWLILFRENLMDVIYVLDFHSQLVVRKATFAAFLTDNLISSFSKIIRFQ